MIAAQECLPDNETRDGFAADYSFLARLWDAISPDPSVEPYEADHGWLGQVNESLKPSTGTGKLLWHTLGAKTINFIHRHVHVKAVRDDLERLVLDAAVQTPCSARRTGEMGGGNSAHPVSYSFHMGCTLDAEFGAESTLRLWSIVALRCAWILKRNSRRGVLEHARQKLTGGEREP